MRAREGLLLLAGVAIGAGAMFLARDTRPAVDDRSPEDVRPRSPSPGMAVDLGARVTGTTRALDEPRPDPARSEETDAPPDARSLAIKAMGLELEMQRLLLARKGEPPNPARVGLEGSPFANMTAEELADDREKAEREVEPLLSRWREAAPGDDRAAAMKALAVPMFRLLERGGTMEHLVTLEEAAERGESRDERRWAMIATHRLWQAPVVDFLLARSRSAHTEVRFYAVEGLAWVRGEEAQRAFDGVVTGLEDLDPGVRGIAALSLGAIVADPGRAEAILARLGRETEPDAAQAMAMAVVKLDPKGARDRVSVAVAAASAEVKAAVEKGLAAPK